MTNSFHFFETLPAPAFSLNITESLGLWADKIWAVVTVSDLFFLRLSKNLVFVSFDNSYTSREASGSVIIVLDRAT